MLYSTPIDEVMVEQILGGARSVWLSVTTDNLLRPNLIRAEQQEEDLSLITLTRMLTEHWGARLVSAP